jgi:hypothetical protein
MLILNKLSNQHKVRCFINNKEYILEPHANSEIKSATPDLQVTIDVDGQYIGSLAQTSNGAYEIYQGVDSPGIYIQPVS